jgi:hypothetical protein
MPFHEVVMSKTIDSTLPKLIAKVKELARAADDSVLALYSIQLETVNTSPDFTKWGFNHRAVVLKCVINRILKLSRRSIRGLYQNGGCPLSPASVHAYALDIEIDLKLALALTQELIRNSEAVLAEAPAPSTDATTGN